MVRILAMTANDVLAKKIFSHIKGKASHKIVSDGK
jgi:hypothetical protein